MKMAWSQISQFKNVFSFKNFRFHLFALLLIPAKVFASACCGGAFTLPAVITGDDAAQLSTSFSRSNIQADVGADGVWTKRKSTDMTQIFKIDGARIFNDRWQAGFSLPVQTRQIDGLGSSSGLGDVALQGGYEYLPEWEYSPWKPRGVGFLTLSLPTGKPYEEAYIDDAGLSSRGRGFWTAGAGTILTKVIRVWDVNAVSEVHRSFERTASGNTFQPGYGGSVATGIGWNQQNLRLGGAIAWAQEDAINVRGVTNSDGHAARFATGTLSASYVFQETWAGSLSYSDQTLFGDPSTTSLSKSVALVLQKRWTR
ncbi:MAG: serine protease spb1 [Bdellovibrionaceae bacterium]|nr:serine protease spb1 [Pseudobdellovibrionaceae bacterium]